MCAAAAGNVMSRTPKVKQTLSLRTLIFTCAAPEPLASPGPGTSFSPESDASKVLTAACAGTTGAKSARPTVTAISLLISLFRPLTASSLRPLA